MSEDNVKETRGLSSGSTFTNAVFFHVNKFFHDRMNTAAVVSINQGDQNGTDNPAGYADATPLVCEADSFNKAVPPATLHRLPFFRPQAGKAAIVMDPQPGDKAVAVFMKRDSSGLTVGKNNPMQPASFRTFDQADGYLLNGFLGETPEIWLHLNPVSGDISLSTKAANIDISCRESGNIDIITNSGNITVKARGDITQEATGTARTKAPNIILEGDVLVTGNLTVAGVSEGEGGGSFKTRGGIENTGGRIRSNAVTLETHNHSGVERGGDVTAAPVSGT